MVAELALQASLPLAGIAVGNGCIGFGALGGCGADSLDLFVSVFGQLAHGIDQSALAAARKLCAGQLDRGLSPGELSADCHAALRTVFEDAGEYNEYHWASPCGADGQGNWGDGSAFACANGCLEDYLKLPQTQAALHVIENVSVPTVAWEQWDGDSALYKITVADVTPLYAALLARNASVLVYNGLRDTGVPDVGAERWVGALAGDVSVPRRKWGKPSDGSLAGWVTEYASGLTYATVVGAGHLVPADRPVESRAMIRAWLKGAPLPQYKGSPCKKLWIGQGWGDFCA